MRFGLKSQEVTEAENINGAEAENAEAADRFSSFESSKLQSTEAENTVSQGLKRISSAAREETVRADAALTEAERGCEHRS